MAGDTMTDEVTETDDHPPVATQRGPRRLLVAAAAVAVLVVAVVVVRQLQGGDQPAGDLAVPYADPQAAGRITLCSADGRAVTGGTTSDRPFAAFAVGETGVPSGLDATGAVATLFGYQPRAGIGPDEFSGIPLTAAGVVADPEVPAVRVTDQVYSVGDFVAAFPAEQDGFVQLRLYLGTPEAGTLTESAYDTADLRVDGDRWQLVSGGDADCGASAALVP